MAARSDRLLCFDYMLAKCINISFKLDTHACAHIVRRADSQENAVPMARLQSSQNQ